MHQAIDRGHGGHGILEDFVPLTEHQVRGDDHAPTFIALRQEGEQHLHFFAALLHVTEVVQDDHFEAFQLFDEGRQAVESLGDQ